jgi:hypothetical protein
VKKLFIVIFWSSLVSGPLAQADYNSLSEDQKRVAVENYTRYKSLDDDKKALIKENWQRYQDLTPARKARLEKKFEVFKRLSTSQKSILLKKAQKRVILQRARATERKVENRLEKRIQNNRKRRVLPPPVAPAPTAPH